jgi:hypothetical protein|tara:strand:+ start:743 stop:928 length:186 start_codon:yes stop_codon:yes gene_type:complete
MKRIYQIEIDTRDFESLYAYRLGIEQQHPLPEEQMVVHDILWQITEQEIDRGTDVYYEAEI